MRRRWTERDATSLFGMTCGIHGGLLMEVLFLIIECAAVSCVDCPTTLIRRAQIRCAHGVFIVDEFVIVQGWIQIPFRNIDFEFTSASKCTQFELAKKKTAR